jgi:hypothetical protein
MLKREFPWCRGLQRVLASADKLMTEPRDGGAADCVVMDNNSLVSPSPYWTLLAIVTAV